MPHITIEYSANLSGTFNGRSLALRIHELLAVIARAELGSCKTRLIAQEQSVVGDGADTNAFLHVDLALLPGRSDEQKRSLGEAVAHAAVSAIAKPEVMALQVSCEVRETDRPNYHKVVLN